MQNTNKRMITNKSIAVPYKSHSEVMFHNFLPVIFTQIRQRGYFLFILIAGCLI